MVTITDNSTAVTSTETDLFTVLVGDNSYGCRVYVDVMATGDTYVFREYVRNASGSLVRKGKPVTRSGAASADDQYVYFAPEFAHGYKVTAQKINGTNRTFNFEVGVY